MPELRSRGASGAAPRFLLQAAGTFPATGATVGDFGHGADQAVLAFQQRAVLPVNGVVRPEKWDALRTA